MPTVSVALADVKVYALEKYAEFVEELAVNEPLGPFNRVAYIEYDGNALINSRTIAEAAIEIVPGLFGPMYVTINYVCQSTGVEFQGRVTEADKRLIFDYLNRRSQNLTNVRMVGVTATLIGIQSRPELNGTKVIIVEHMRLSRRYKCKLPNGQFISVAEQNLTDIRESYVDLAL